MRLSNIYFFLILRVSEIIYYDVSFYRIYERDQCLYFKYDYLKIAGSHLVIILIVSKIERKIKSEELILMFIYLNDKR